MKDVECVTSGVDRDAGSSCAESLPTPSWTETSTNDECFTVPPGQFHQVPQSWVPVPMVTKEQAVLNMQNKQPSLVDKRRVHHEVCKASGAAGTETSAQDCLEKTIA